VIIIFTYIHRARARALAATGGPDLSVSSANADILFSIPGVSASLLCYFVFGTTKSWRQYRDLIVSGCGCFRRTNQSKRIWDGEGTSNSDREVERVGGPSKERSPEKIISLRPYSRNSNMPKPLSTFPKASITTTISITSKFPTNLPGKESQERIIEFDESDKS